MSRYRATLEYFGKPFAGWQRQKNGFSVQQALEEAIKNFCGQDVVTYVAGRTDAGVHALGQACHFEIEKKETTKTIRNAINFHLKPNPIIVLNVVEVDETFHARFSAKERHYRYKFINRATPSALYSDLSWWVPQALDIDLMIEASKCLIGKHDFSTFRAAGCQAKTPVKTLNSITFWREGDEVIMETRAKSFLYHQVRNMAGTLKLVGEKKWTIENFSNAFNARTRVRGGITAPACGLYFMKVDY